MAQEVRAALPLERQHQIVNATLNTRLAELMPALMEACGVDFWLITCYEYNEDPVFSTLIPAAQGYGHRLSCLAFARNRDGSMDALNLARPLERYAPYYKQLFTPQGGDPMPKWEFLAQIINRYNPKTIAINVSENCAMADGLPKAFYDRLLESIGQDFRGRLISSERLAIRWFESRTHQELMLYDSVYGLAESIFNRGLSRDVITPGLTTTEDVEWWLKEEACRLGLHESFPCRVRVLRQGFTSIGSPVPAVIMSGDLVCCDFGIKYLGLATGMQRPTYVLRQDEADAPDGLRKAYRDCVRLQEICAGCFEEGLSGNQIFAASMSKALEEGFKPQIYTRPIGYCHHSPGPIIGLIDCQGHVLGMGECQLYKNTCFALELDNTAYVPEWGQDVTIALKETTAFLCDGSLRYYGSGGRDTLRCI